MKCGILKSLADAKCIATVALLAMVILRASETAQGQVGIKTFTGTFPDHATYLIEVPHDWNGTLFLYSHGTGFVGEPNPPTDNGDVLVRLYLLTNGYALAGSSYARLGWAVEDALRDQVAVLDTFDRLVGHPSRTIAWGHSMGGLITAGLVQRHPDRFSGAVCLCGLVAGSVGVWNEFLDAAFAFNTLLALGKLEIVHITDPIGNRLNAAHVLNDAATTPQGQARIALAAALADTSGWDDPLSPQPDPTDFATLVFNQFESFSGFNFDVFFALRADVERRAGGNPSWNNGVDYEKQLKLSVDYAEVLALYQQAGLNLADDLKKLNDAKRIVADPSAVTYLSNNIVFNGELRVPVLTVHTSGDDIANVQMEEAYAAVVHKANGDSFLRQTFVHRAGHCAFTSAEMIAALQTLVRRLDTGEWQGADPKSLNAAASGLPMAYDDIFGAGSQPLLPPAFFDYAPAPFLRPSNSLDQLTGPPE
jgi:pimeloyl-ACP methyl ester carboxylesterase